MHSRDGFLRVVITGICGAKIGSKSGGKSHPRATPTSTWSTRISVSSLNSARDIQNLECPRLHEYITQCEEHLEKVIRIIDDTITNLFEGTPKKTG